MADEPGPVMTDRDALIIGATHSFEETPHPFLILAPGSEADTHVGDGRWTIARMVEAGARDKHNDGVSVLGRAHSGRRRSA